MAGRIPRSRPDPSLTPQRCEVCGSVLTPGALAGMYARENWQRLRPEGPQSLAPCPCGAGSYVLPLHTAGGPLVWIGHEEGRDWEAWLAEVDVAASSELFLVARDLVAPHAPQAPARAYARTTGVYRDLGGRRIRPRRILAASLATLPVGETSPTSDHCVSRG